MSLRESQPGWSKMKGSRSALGVIFCLLLWSARTTALAEGNANLSMGLRSLDEGTWNPVDDHVMGGVSVDFAGEGWPLHLAAGIYRSDDEERDEVRAIGICLPLFCVPPQKVVAKASVSELALGVVKIWKPGERVRLFLGGGGAIVALNSSSPNRGPARTTGHPACTRPAGFSGQVVSTSPFISTSGSR
jgi:hypothetical protein